MASVVWIGIPVLGGLVGGSILEVAMRTYGLSLFQKIGVEVSLMSLGSIVIYLKPPGSPFGDDSNWGTCMLAASLVTTGGFARIINIVLPGDGAAVLIALGLLVAVAMGPYVLAEVGEWLGRLLAGGFYVGRGTPPVRQRRRTP